MNVRAKGTKCFVNSPIFLIYLSCSPDLVAMYFSNINLSRTKDINSLN